METQVRHGMMNTLSLANLAGLESDLWEAADQLRANSKLTSSQYFLPVLGIIFLRHAHNRYLSATQQIATDQAAGKMPKRRLTQDDYKRRRALMLPETARWDYLVDLPTDTDLGEALNAAMAAIEQAFEPLQGQLPKNYTALENELLEPILRIFNRDALTTAGGDVFGRIYEYFLMKFAVQGAWDNGEFFTPPSLVQMIVNVIEPDHGKLLDPATGSGGMFVQSSHFIERSGHDTAHRISFYGQEKNPTTINLANMNLAVHGLEGDIREANTFYEDVHELTGKCDFVMANPPFNVDMVDAEKVETDVRLPFGLPSVNKKKCVSNANYLWISYFHSYLNETGRVGFVMSSQASSAGHGEKEVRRKIVETGDVDVMISIRQNFFYTRSVPCELWFFDRGKPEDRRDHVLMIDARNVFRQVTRKTNDFSPEHLATLSAVVWLYRGRRERFLGLVKQYLSEIVSLGEAVPEKLETFRAAFSELDGELSEAARQVRDEDDVDADVRQAVDEALRTFEAEVRAYKTGADEVVEQLEKWRETLSSGVPDDNEAQHAARSAFEPIADAIRQFLKQIDSLYRQSGRLLDALEPAANGPVEGLTFDRRAARRLLKDADAARTASVGHLRQVNYFHRQVVWLHDRFPEAELADVPGLVKLVSRADIEANDWSLTPGRFVGVAPVKEDEDFDFGEAIREIHQELADLNEEAVGLAETIQRSLGELVA